MTEIFVESLGTVWVNDSIAKFDLLTTAPGSNGGIERQLACRVVIPVGQAAAIIGRLHEYLLPHIEASGANADAQNQCGEPLMPAEPVDDARQSVVVLSVSKFGR